MPLEPRLYDFAHDLTAEVNIRGARMRASCVSRVWEWNLTTTGLYPGDLQTQRPTCEAYYTLSLSELSVGALFTQTHL